MEVVKLPNGRFVTKPVKERAYVAPPELPRLEFTKRRVMQDFETETFSAGCTASSINEAKDGILFLIECEALLKDREQKK